eukprot:768812-Hanusia_phi.AAC.1
MGEARGEGEEGEEREEGRRERRREKREKREKKGEEGEEREEGRSERRREKRERMSLQRGAVKLGVVIAAGGLQDKSPSARQTETPQTSKLLQTKLLPYGMLSRPTRHFFSDGSLLLAGAVARALSKRTGDGLWGEHNPHFGSQTDGDSRW